jgi:hypothetical protein
MPKLSSIQPFERTLAASAVERIHAYGRFLTILQITNADEAYVQLPGQPFVPLDPAVSFELPQGSQFDHIQIKNPSTTTAITVKFYLSEAPVVAGPGATLVDLLSDIKTALVGTGTAVATIGPTTVGTAQVQLVAAAATARKVVIQAKSTNTDSIFVGLDNTVTTAANYIAELLPGGSVTIESTTSAIHAISGTAGQSAGGFVE